MNLGVAFVADPQAAEVVQVREAAFDDPALAADAGAVFGAAAGDHWFDPASPEQPPVLVVVIATVGDDQIGFLARTAGPAGDRAAVQGVEQRQELGDVVALPAGQRDRQGDAGGVDEEMVL